METRNREALVAFIAGWLSSNGHGSAESLALKVNLGVGLLLDTAREAAMNDMEREMAEVDEGLRRMDAAREKREEAERKAFEERELLPRQIVPAGTDGPNGGTFIVLDPPAAEEIGGAPQEAGDEVIVPVAEAPVEGEAEEAHEADHV